MRISDWSSDVCSSDLLISAAPRAGAGVVAVPIETRYAGAAAPALMRTSHFRLFHALRRITTHVVAQAWKHCDVVAAYRRCRAFRAVMDRADKGRVGHGSVCQCRSRGWPVPSTTNTK